MRGTEEHGWYIHTYVAMDWMPLDKQNFGASPSNSQLLTYAAMPYVTYGQRYINKTKKNTKTLQSVPINLAKSTTSPDHIGIAWYGGREKAAGVAPMLIKCQQEKHNIRAELYAILEHTV